MLDKGPPARCLWFEAVDHADSGVIVLGLNPGRASAEELNDYVGKAGRELYEATVKYLMNASRDINFYTRLREFIRSAFDDKPLHVLWTEIAKCEILRGEKAVPVRMQRACAWKFLVREVKEVPPTWPIIAAGDEAYRAAAFLFPERKVIGVPHPSGGRPNRFHELFDPHADWDSTPRRLKLNGDVEETLRRTLQVERGCEKVRFSARKKMPWSSTEQ